MEMLRLPLYSAKIDAQNPMGRLENRAMKRRIARWALAMPALALLTAGAQAQLNQNTPGMQGSQIGQHVDKSEQNEAKQPKVKADDKAYGAALKNIPDKKYDPWHGMR
jgi:predicted transcriptional regulator